jgi:tripartite-type tricarboxylate transporter receptor subunit TctC
MDPPLLANRAAITDRARSILLLAFLVAGCAANAPSPTVLAQGYPARPVRLIEPFGVGGESDLLARALAQELSVLWQQPVSVENITGVGVEAGSAQVAKSPADGYTLLVSTNAQAYSAARWRNLPYDPLKDFTPIAALMSQPYVLVAGKAAGIRTVGELIAAARAKPGELTFGSSGVGTGTHLAAEKFNRAAGVEALHAQPGPADTFAGAIDKLVAGHISYRMMPIASILPQIQGGQLIPLAVSTARRSALLPDVPTIAEAGVAGFDFPIWHGVWAPAGTPAHVVGKLAKDIRRVLAGPHLQDWLVRHDGQPMAMTQPQFTRFVRRESDSAVQIVKSAETVSK